MTASAGEWAARAFALGLAATLGAGCTVGSRDTLGLSAPPPDEFLVVSRRPLERPANMAALPLPQPGARNRVDPDPVEDARLALSGAPATSPTSPPALAGEAAVAALSPAEQTLIQGAGADAADPAIRQRLAEEAFVPRRRFGLDSLFGVPIVQDPADAARRVQPSEEAARLRGEGLPAPTAPPAPPEDAQTTP